MVANSTAKFYAKFITTLCTIFGHCGCARLAAPDGWSVVRYPQRAPPELGVFVATGSHGVYGICTSQFGFMKLSDRNVTLETYHHGDLVYLEEFSGYRVVEYEATAFMEEHYHLFRNQITDDNSTTPHTLDANWRGFSDGDGLLTVSLSASTVATEKNIIIETIAIDDSVEVALWYRKRISDTYSESLHTYLTNTKRQEFNPDLRVRTPGRGYDAYFACVLICAPSLLEPCEPYVTQVFEVR